MQIKAIIFDCDGVLVESDPLCIDILTKNLNLICTNITRSEVQSLFKTSSFKVLESAFEKTFKIKLPKNFEDEFRQEYSMRALNELKPIDGIEEFLQKASIKKCVATSGPLKKVESSLDATGLRKYFGDLVFSSYQIDSFKPEPDLFLHAAAMLGVEPRDCMVIEDSMEGVQAGVAAGMKVFGFNPNGILDEVKNSSIILFDNFRTLSFEASEVFHATSHPTNRDQRDS